VKELRKLLFAFTVKGRPSAEIPALTLGDKVAVSSGNFYAYRLTQAHKMVAQYPWLYERAGLFAWREKAR